MKENLRTLETKRGKVDRSRSPFTLNRKYQGDLFTQIPQKSLFVAPAAGVFVDLPLVVFGECPQVGYWCLPPVASVGWTFALC